NLKGFFGTAEAIEVEMGDGRVALIELDKGEGRRRHVLVGARQGADQTPRQGRLSHAQRAVQQDGLARRQQGGDGFTQAGGGVGVGKVESHQAKVASGSAAKVRSTKVFSFRVADWASMSNASGGMGRPTIRSKARPFLFSSSWKSVMSRSSCDTLSHRWYRRLVGPETWIGMTGASYLRASAPAVAAHSGSVSRPSGPTRARRPAGNMTTQRSASNASLAAWRVARVFASVRLADT